MKWSLGGLLLLAVSVAALALVPGATGATNPPKLNLKNVPKQATVGTSFKPKATGRAGKDGDIVEIWKDPQPCLKETHDEFNKHPNATRLKYKTVNKGPFKATGSKVSRAAPGKVYVCAYLSRPEGFSLNTYKFKQKVVTFVPADGGGGY